MTGLLATSVGHLEYANETTLHPLGLAMVVAGGLCLLATPRRFALWPLFVVAVLVAPAQRLVVFGLDFNLLRIMVLFGWLRVLTRGEFAGFRWQPLDRVLIAMAAVQTLAYTLLRGSSGALIYQLGVSFDALGLYFVFRWLLLDWRDVRCAVTGFLWLSVPVSLALVVEAQTGRNAFAFFGGVPEFTVMREGRLRCQGAFAHPILAGCFWAAVMPLIAARWWDDSSRRWQVGLGLVACCTIIVCCSSSTPVLALLAAILGGAAFALRRHLVPIGWSIVGLLVVLHWVMKAPVWHLIARISAVGGSTGWHRYHLIDQAINNFDEWWLLGVTDISHWHVWANDITNQFVFQAVIGGAPTLALFVAAIVCGFRAVSATLRHVAGDRRHVALTWAVGVSLFVHCASFIGVTYFGQIIMMWYLSLALAASVAVIAERRPAPRRRGVRTRRARRQRHTLGPRPVHAP